MSFDLNIDNYTRDELLQMFELPPNFDRNILEIKEVKLRDSIVNNQEINKDTKTKTLNFLTKAKNIILNNITEKLHSLKNVIADSYNTNFELKTTDIEEPTEHMVQVRSERPFVQSFPSEFFPGTINPIRKRTIKKNLNIDTRFRDNYYTSSSTNFNIILPVVFNNVLQMQLSAIELPKSYYVVSKQYGNNFFNLVVTSSASTNPFSTIIQIPDGNYDQNTILYEINNQLSLAGAPYNNISFAINLTTGNTGSGQVLVGVQPTPLPSPAYPITGIELNFQADIYGNPDQSTPLPLKFGWLLGFRNGIYVNNLNYVSEAVLDVTGPRYLFLVVDDHNNSVNNGFYAAFNSSMLNKNILARISLQVNTSNIIEQNNLNLVTTPREYFGPVNLQNLNIQLLDEYGRTVDLNNMDYSFCVTLITTYDI
jgi:hypothetical protein